MSNGHEIEICANSIEEFKNIQNLLNKLSSDVKDQIYSAKMGLGALKCVFDIQYKDKDLYKLPVGVTQICDFDDYVGIYCDVYFFKIMKREDQIIEYVFE